MSSDRTDGGSYISELRLSHPRKRHQSKKQPLQLNTTSPPSKKRRLSYPGGYQPPQAFWDNLSKIWLTKAALSELERRNSHPSRRPGFQFRQSHGSITRGALDEWKNKQNCPADENAADFLSHCLPEDVKGIKLSARHGGPDLRDLRGYREPVNLPRRTMSSSQPSSQARNRGSNSTISTNPTTITTTTQRSGPYSRNFQQNLTDHGVYPNRYEYPDGRLPSQPDNWEEIQQRMTQARPSLSLSQFSDGKFRKFEREDAHAAKEMQVMDSVIPIIEGNVGDARCVVGGIPFTNLDHLTDGTLAAGKPDRYYGARPEQLSRQVREELSGRIVPSTHKDLPIAPNFFLVVKGPNGTTAVARNQATYDGALGARGMHSLHSYAQKGPVYDNNAYTISSIYNDGTLKMYTSHPSQPARAGDNPEYYMTQLRSFSMTDTADTFRQGATAYRNLRDWTKEQRDLAIERANGTANAGHFDQVSTFATEASLEEAVYLSQDSRTSLNEHLTSNPDSKESEILTDDTITCHGRSAKQSTTHPELPHQLRRKRRNAGKPRRAKHRHQSVSHVSPAVYSPTAEEQEQP
ncbi:MAG: hypothetical protein M1825_002631 [Sarcosagium campestre]|nr:MAG: hypothetical protein M1825_002631 [Sarcosagium campestre]